MAWMAELEALEARYPDLADPNSPTQRVGGDITKEFPVVKHRFPMLSLPTPTTARTWRTSWAGWRRPLAGSPSRWN